VVSLDEDYAITASLSGNVEFINLRTRIRTISKLGVVISKLEIIVRGSFLMIFLATVLVVFQIDRLQVVTNSTSVILEYRTVLNLLVLEFSSEIAMATVVVMC
jgi:hypothetical protein